jgi:hypothetical protein
MFSISSLPVYEAVVGSSFMAYRLQVFGGVDIAGAAEPAAFDRGTSAQQLAGAVIAV